MRHEAIKSVVRSETATHRHGGPLLASCAFAGALALSVAPALAGCNSGNVGNTSLLTSATCQANGSGIAATAVGEGAGATGFASTAIGNNALAIGGFSTAAGQSTRATGSGSTAVGRAAGNNGGVAGATFVGAFSGWNGGGLHSVAVGAGASGDSSPNALGDYSIAIGGGDGAGGNGAWTNNTFGIAIGTGAQAIGVRSTSVGAFAGLGGAAGNNRNSAFGTEAGQNVTGGGNTATGLASGITVVGDLNSALGNSAGVFVTGNNNTASGVLAGVTVNGSFNAAYGDNAGRDVTGSSNVALGASAGRNVTASHTVAVGTSARATAHNAVAIGRNASSIRARAVAIGHGSVANAIDTVSVGNNNLKRRIVNVAPGTQPNDAVNLAQLQAATAATSTASIGSDVNLRQELTALRALVQRLEGLLAQQQQRIAQLERRNVAAAPAE
jgi:hypothetical protein